jgi:serine/threonine protein kinase
MGEVLLGSTSSKLGFEKRVAIKTVRADFDDQEDYRTLFFDEAHLAARLNHPNLCQVFDFGEDDGRLYLVMEFADGLSIEKLVLLHQDRMERIPENFAARIVAQAARGLHSAHTITDDQGELLNVVHRDVSPQNIIVTFDGCTKVLDFGIARNKERQAVTQMGIVRGKPGYMAPEQARAEDLDARTDIFQLGIVLYEMLTGDELFVRNTVYASINAVVNEPIPDLLVKSPNMNPGYVEIVNRALEKNPANRYETADAMAWALDQVISTSQDPATDALVAKYINSIRPKKPQSQKKNVSASSAHTTQVMATPPKGQSIGRQAGQATAVLAGSPTGQETGRPEGQETAALPSAERKNAGLSESGSTGSSKPHAVLVSIEEEEDGFMTLSREVHSDDLKVSLPPQKQPSRLSGVVIGLVAVVALTALTWRILQREELPNKNLGSAPAMKENAPSEIKPNDAEPGRENKVERSGGGRDGDSSSKPLLKGTKRQNASATKAKKPTRKSPQKENGSKTRRPSSSTPPKMSQSSGPKKAATVNEGDQPRVGANVSNKKEAAGRGSEKETADSKPQEAAGKAWVTIQADPYGFVFLDGKRIGNTPIVRYMVPAGKHVVEIFAPDSGKRRHRETFTVKKDKTKKILFRE